MEERISETLTRGQSEKQTQDKKNALWQWRQGGIAVLQKSNKAIKLTSQNKTEKSCFPESEPSYSYPYLNIKTLVSSSLGCPNIELVCVEEQLGCNFQLIATTHARKPYH